MVLKLATDLAHLIKYVYIITVFVICMFLFITLCIQFWRNDQKAKGNKDPFGAATPIHWRLQFISIGSMIFYIFAMISYIVAEIYYDNIYWIGIPYSFVSFNWAFGNFFVYLLFIYRLQDVFKNTIHELADKTTLILLCGMIIFLISQIGVAISSLLFTLNIGSGTGRFIVSDVLLFTEDLCDIIVTVVLLTLFTKKILATTVFTGDTQIANFDMNALNQIQINYKQELLLKIATKMFVLTLCGTMTTQFVTWWAIFAFFYLEHNLGDFYPIHYVLICLSLLDILSNTICIFLSFKFNDYWYNKLCAPLHECCGLCCLRITKKKIINEYIRKSTVVEMTQDHSFDNKNIKMYMQHQHQYHQLI